MIGAQVKAARALIGWSQDKLAAEAGVATQTVKRAEWATSERPAHDTEVKLTAAFERAGVRFTFTMGQDGHGSVGVSLDIYDETYAKLNAVSLLKSAAENISKIEKSEPNKDKKFVYVKLLSEIEALTRQYHSEHEATHSGEPSPEDARKMVGISVGIGRFMEPKPKLKQ